MLMFVNILLLLFAATPLVNGFGYFDTYELPKFIWINALILCFVCVAIFKIRKENFLRLIRDMGSSKLVLLIVIFGLLHIISTLQNSNLDLTSLLGNPYRYNGMIFFTLISLLCLVIRYSNPWTNNRYLHMTEIFTIFGVISSSIVIFDFVCIHTGIMNVPNYLGRPVGTFGNPNHAGGYIAMILAIAISAKKMSEIRLKEIIILAIMLAAIIATGSLSALFSVFVVFLVGFLLQKKANILHMSVLVLMTVLVISFYLFTKSQSYQNSRLEIWQKSISAISTKPLFGWGIEKIDIAIKSQLSQYDFYMKEVKIDRTHNIWLDTAVQGGIITLLLRVVILTAIVKRMVFQIYNPKSIRPYAKSTLLVLTAFESFALFNVVGIAQYVVVTVYLALTSHSGLKSRKTI